MTNVENIRNYILASFNQILDLTFKNQGLEHTFTVASFAGVLAIKRNENQELAQIAAYLHDLAFYQTHYHPSHALRSAKIALPILNSHTNLSENEKEAIITAIKNHSQKDETHSPLAEILKDADVLAHALSDGPTNLSIPCTQRLNRLL